VHDIAYLGGHSVFYVELPGGKVVQSFMANAERRGARPTWDDQGLRLVGRRQRRGTALMRTFNQQFLRLVPSGRKLVIGIPFIWLFLFFMLPFFLVMKISFSEAALVDPAVLARSTPTPNRNSS
jgi:hypothetical protein